MTQQLRLMAFDLDASPDPAGREQKVASLEAATRLVPGYGRLQAELAHAHLTVLELRMDELTASVPARCGGWTRANRASEWAWRDRSGAIDASAFGAGTAAFLTVARCLSP